MSIQYGEQESRGQQRGQAIAQGVQQQQEWKQKQQVYQQQAQALALRALQDQEFQKTMGDIQSQVQSGKMTQDQAHFMTGLAFLKRGQAGSAGASAAMTAMKPPMVKPFNIPRGGTAIDPQTGKVIGTGQAVAPPVRPPVRLSPGQTLVDPTTGKPMFSAPVAPPAPTPSSVREIPVLNADGTPDPTQFAIPTPKGLVVKSRPKPSTAKSTTPKVTDINRYHKSKQGLMTAQAILSNPTKLTEWAGLHADGDEAQAKETLTDQAEAAQEDMDALKEVYPDYDFVKGAAPPAADKVKVKSPDGKIGTIPSSQLEDAKKAGYTLAQ